MPGIFHYIIVAIKKVKKYMIDSINLSFVGTEDTNAKLEITIGRNHVDRH